MSLYVVPVVIYVVAPVAIAHGSGSDPACAGALGLVATAAFVLGASRLRERPRLYAALKVAAMAAVPALWLSAWGVL